MFKCIISSMLCTVNARNMHLKIFRVINLHSISYQEKAFQIINSNQFASKCNYLFFCMKQQT